MKCGRFSILIAAIVIVCLSTTHLLADDLVVSGTITGPHTYDSPEGIIFNDATIQPGSEITAISTLETRLRPGTHILAGAHFSATLRDNDGLSNRCEMYYFGNLNHAPGEDLDADLLTNLEECTLGTNPAAFDMDNDDDGLEDWWEIRYAGLHLDYFDGRNGDADGDGISNWIEFRLGSDPTHVNDRGPGLHYEYDDLGRITKIQRIPSR